MRRIIRLDERIGQLLDATDGFTLRQRDHPLHSTLMQSNDLRNNLIHRANLPVSEDVALTTIVAVMALIRLLDPRVFWRAVFGFSGLPTTTHEVVESVPRAVRVRFGVPKATIPSITISGRCSSHLAVSDLTAEGFLLRHADPLDHSWHYMIAAESNP